MPEGLPSSGEYIRSTATSGSDRPIGRVHAYVDLPPLEPLGSGPAEPRIDDLLVSNVHMQAPPPPSWRPDPIDRR